MRTMPVEIKEAMSFNYDDASLTEGVICLSRHLRPDFPASEVTEQLDHLVALAKEEMPFHQDEEAQLEKLIELFYKEWGFGGAHGTYKLSDALWLDKVLASRQGMPMILGTIFSYIAYHLGVPVKPVIFPTQLILKADIPSDEMWFINPLNGETLSEHLLEAWIQGYLGSTAMLEYNDLDVAANSVVIQKMLDTLKVALMEEQQMDEALRANELALFFAPDDPYEIRDRGLIYAFLECNEQAIKDLNYFVKQCPEDPLTNVIQMQIHTIDTAPVVLH